MDLKEIRRKKFAEFTDSCRRVGGKPMRVTEDLHFCYLDDFTIELGQHRGSIYGNFLIKKEGKMLGVAFDQRTLTVI